MLIHVLISAPSRSVLGKLLSFLFAADSNKYGSGEKCSRSSADAGNRCRSLSDAGRQHSGRKMDYLFTTKQIEYEIGCGECALVGGVNTTKEFQDAGFKMPKVMRDVMYKIVSDSPGLVHKLHIPGYFIADKVLTLWILDAPAGYVCRHDAFPSVQYPVVESKQVDK